MSRLIGGVLCSLLLCVSGCTELEANRVVVVDFPVSQHLSAGDPEIQKALKIIDKVFVANGFSRVELTPEDEAQGIIANYHPHNVSVKGHSLIVAFNEHRRSRSSALVMRTCDLMKEELSKQFGAQRVKVREE